MTVGGLIVALLFTSLLAFIFAVQGYRSLNALVRAPPWVGIALFVLIEIAFVSVMFIPGPVIVFPTGGH
jgi:hypothetical protein